MHQRKTKIYRNRNEPTIEPSVPVPEYVVVIFVATTAKRRGNRTEESDIIKQLF